MINSLKNKINKIFNNDFISNIDDEIFNFISKRKKIAVACSGGPDSLFVLFLIYYFFYNSKNKIYVFHYNHGIRKESDKEEKFVSNIAKKLGCIFISEKRICKKNEKINEAFLREARSFFFLKNLKKEKISILVQGHQKDDIIESILMRLIRGAGLDGLLAPQKIVKKDDVYLVRPILNIDKDKIIKILDDLKIPYCIDKTNFESIYFRNKIRNEIIPKLKDISPFNKLDGFIRTQKLLNEDAKFLDNIVDNLFSNDCKNIENKWFLNYDFRKHSFRAINRRILWKILLKEKVILSPINIEKCLDSFEKEENFKISIDEKNYILFLKNILVFEKINDIENTPIFKKISFNTILERKFLNIKLRENEILTCSKIKITKELYKKIISGEIDPKTEAFLNESCFKGDFLVRHWEKDDKLQILGAKGEKTVGNIFTDKKISKNMRHLLPFCCDGIGIAWIPGLPIADRLKIKKIGEKALRLTYKPSQF